VAFADGFLVPIPSRYKTVYYSTGKGEPLNGIIKHGVLKLTIKQAEGGVSLYTRQDLPFFSVYKTDYTAIKAALAKVKQAKPSNLRDSDTLRMLRTLATEVETLKDAFTKLDKTLARVAAPKDRRLYILNTEALSAEYGHQRLADLEKIRTSFTGHYSTYVGQLEKALSKVRTKAIMSQDSLVLEKSGKALWKAQEELISYHNHFVAELDKYITYCQSYIDQKVKVYDKWDDVESRKVALNSKFKLTSVQYSITNMPSVKYPKQHKVQRASAKRTILLPDNGYLSKHFPKATLNITSVECVPVNISRQLSTIKSSLNIKRQSAAVSLPFKVVAMPEPFSGNKLQAALESSRLQYTADKPYLLTGLTKDSALVMPGSKLNAPKGFSVLENRSLPYPKCVNGRLNKPRKHFTLSPDKALWIVLVSGQEQHIDLMDSWGSLDPFSWDKIIPMIKGLAVPANVPVTLSFVQNTMNDGRNVTSDVTHIRQSMTLGGKLLEKSLGEAHISDWVCNYQVSPAQISNALKKVVASGYDDTDVIVVLLCYPGAISTGSLNSFGSDVDVEVVDIWEDSRRRGGTTVRTPAELKKAMNKIIKGI